MRGLVGCTLLFASLWAIDASAQAPDAAAGGEGPVPSPAPSPPPEAPSAPPTPQALAKAKALFDAGAREYEAGRFDAALQAFEQAYRFAPRDGIVFSMAQSHRRQHTVTGDAAHLVRSVELYKKYVASVRQGGRVTDAVRALGELEPLLKTLSATADAPAPVAAPRTRIVVNIVAPGTMVAIDGAPPRPAPVNVDVAPGEHTVRLVAPGYFDEEARLSLGEGEFATANLPQRERPARLSIATNPGAAVHVDGRFMGEAPLSRPLELPSGRHFVAVVSDGHLSFEKELDLARGSTTPLEADLSTTTQRDLSYAVLIGGGTVLVAAGAFAAVAVVREADAIELRDRATSVAIAPSDVEAYESARDDRETFTAMAGGAAAGGVALGLLGLGLYVFDQPRPVAPPSLEPAPRDRTPDRTPREPSDVEVSGSFWVAPGTAGGTLVGRF